MNYKILKFKKFIYYLYLFNFLKYILFVWKCVIKEIYYSLVLLLILTNLINTLFSVFIVKSNLIKVTKIIITYHYPILNIYGTQF